MAHEWRKKEAKQVDRMRGVDGPERRPGRGAGGSENRREEYEKLTQFSSIFKSNLRLFCAAALEVLGESESRQYPRVAAIIIGDSEPKESSSLWPATHSALAPLSCYDKIFAFRAEQ